jgi:hypothetical protein
VSMIFLWKAGLSSGTAESRDGVLGEARPHLAGGAGVLVEEATVVMTPARFGGVIPEHKRTGRAWNVRLLDGSPSWEQADPEASR